MARTSYFTGFPLNENQTVYVEDVIRQLGDLYTDTEEILDTTIIARDQAVASAQSATSSENNAVAARDDALVAKQEAQDAAYNAEQERLATESARDTALGAESNAASSASLAQDAQTAAEGARDAAQAAQSSSEDAREGAETARDIAQGYASDIVSQGNVPIYASVATVEGLNINPGITALRTNGCYSPGDGGGALYKRVPSEPSHAGKVQDAGGRWFELAEKVVRPQMLGAVGDGVADDTEPLRQALRLQRTLDLGQGHYRLTEPIEESLDFVDIAASGAVIEYDPPQPTQRCIMITVGLGGVFASKGVLQVRCNRMAFDGFSVYSAATEADDEDDYPSVVGEDIRVRDVHRGSTDFSGGNGIIVSGGFKQVSLIRPWAENCTMAAGAGVQGSQGIFGITVARQNDLSAKSVVVVDPYVDYVASEDPAYLNDQDGIRIYGRYTIGQGKPLSHNIVVRGGVLRNCRNRSIKAQSQNCVISGVHLEKDAAVIPAGATLAPDIDIQISGGNVSDISFHYDGAYPGIVVSLASPRGNGSHFNGGHLRGLTGFITGGTLTAPIRINHPSASEPGPATRCSISDVNINGQSEYALYTRILGDSVGTFISIANVWLDCTEAFVSFGSAASPAEVLVQALNCHHTGAGLVEFASDYYSSKRVSVIGGSGFVDHGQNRTSHPPGAFARLGAILPADAGSSSGIIRPYSAVVGDGQSVEVPMTGYDMGAHLMLVSAGRPANARAIVAVNSVNAEILAQSGSGWEAGGTTEPPSGDFRVWKPSNTEGAMVSNHSGASRVITMLMIG